MNSIQLIPGNDGVACPANGRNPEVECGCEACDYLQCCMDGWEPSQCDTCEDNRCPRFNRESKEKQAKKV